LFRQGIFYKVHALHAEALAMTQLTIRRLDKTVIDGLKKRAAAAGRSMEEEARRILSDAVIDEQMARQRAWVVRMKAKHKELYGDQVFPDSSDEFRKMREERTRQIEEWALPPRKPKS
jgi:plasmid stability protein